MSKLIGNQEFDGDVYVKGVGGYDGTNPAVARRIQDALMQCTGVKNIISLTKAEYDALANKDSETIYVVGTLRDMPAGTIVYYDGSQIKFCSPKEWISSLGTPVAVVVVPGNHTTDGTVRCIAVTGVNTDGAPLSYDKIMEWGHDYIDTPLPNLTEVPAWNNTVGGTIRISGSGYLPSNNNSGYFTGAIDCLDSNLHYHYDADKYGLYIPNPYLPDGTPNPDFRNTSIVTNNACADFNGASNTSVIVGLGTANAAANACHLYSADGISAGNWYLPACGELAYIMPRFTQIQNALNAVGGIQLDTGNMYWSSNENDSDMARGVSTNSGNVYSTFKDRYCYVRCFCSLPAPSPIPSFNLYKGSSPINDTYSKSEIDEKIGGIESILATI